MVSNQEGFNLSSCFRKKNIILEKCSTTLYKMPFTKEVTQQHKTRFTHKGP